MKISLIFLLIIIIITFLSNLNNGTGNNGTKNVEIMTSLKYLRHFWTTLEMLLINCEIILMLNWCTQCLLVAGAATNQVPTFTITNTKCYVPDVTLSTQDNVKLLKQLE